MKDELVDVLDEKGRKTGQVLLKSEVHRKSLWHGGTHLWIYNSKGEVLLQRRHPSKLIRPNMWDISVAGHIPAGKTPLENAIEEAAEELGLKVNPKKIKFVGTVKSQTLRPADKFSDKEWNHRVVNWVHLVEMDVNLQDLTLEEGETSDTRWVLIDEFDKEIHRKINNEFPPGIIHVHEFGIAKMRERLKK